MKITTLIIVIVLLIISITEQCILYDKQRHTMKFNNTFNKTGSPILEFYSNSKKLNFLIDTGSDYSFIDSTILKDIIHKKADVTEETSVSGIGGEVPIEGYFDVTFYYKNLEYTHLFQAFDFKESRNYAGVTINGIIGNDFLSKYRYFIDFKNLSVYSSL